MATCSETSAMKPDSDLGNNNDFANNLFSDLSPIIALFGEKFAQQYMSYSTEFLDCVVFALAPLGVVTAIIGAIRVGGPSWLRSLIGRARETRAMAEMELMSSTSHEVCELWNGSTVVRVMGKPEMRQFLYFEDVKDWRSKPLMRQREEFWRDRDFLSETGTRTREPESTASTQQQRAKVTASEWPRHGITNGNCGLFDLEEAEKEGLIKREREKGYAVYQRLKLALLFISRSILPGATSSAREQRNPAIPPKEIQSTAPNVCLNLAYATSRIRIPHWELILATLIGVFSQIGAILFARIVAFKPEKIGLEEGARNTFSYPLYVVGSALVFGGMLICAAIVDHSTVETRWTVTDSRTKMYILWIQYGKIINDQTFESLALFRRGTSDRICVSHRREYGEFTRVPEAQPERSHGSWIGSLTVFGCALGVTGFISQFVGLRGMHSAASGAQLSALIVMTIVRAVLRRGVSSVPNAYKIKAGFEMDWLATAIATSEWKLGTIYASSREVLEQKKGVFQLTTVPLSNHHQARYTRSSPWWQEQERNSSPNIPASSSQRRSHGGENLETAGKDREENQSESGIEKVSKVQVKEGIIVHDQCDGCGIQLHNMPQYECLDCEGYHNCITCYSEAAFKHAYHRFRKSGWCEKDEKASEPVNLRASTHQDLETQNMWVRTTVVGIRSQLSEMLDLPEGPVTVTSRSLATAIEKTLDTLQCKSDEELESESLPSRNAAGSADALGKSSKPALFSWELPIFINGLPKTLTLFAGNPNRHTTDKLAVWKLHTKLPGKHFLEAIISLSMYSVEMSRDGDRVNGMIGGGEHTKGRVTTEGNLRLKGVRILGPYTEQLQRDLHWWIPEGSSRKVQTFEISEGSSSGFNFGAKEKSLYLQPNQIILPAELIFGNYLDGNTCKTSDRNGIKDGNQSGHSPAATDYSDRIFYLLFGDLTRGSKTDNYCPTHNNQHSDSNDGRNNPQDYHFNAATENREFQPLVVDREARDYQTSRAANKVILEKSDKLLGIIEPMRYPGYNFAQHIFSLFMEEAAKRATSIKTGRDMAVSYRGLERESHSDWRNFQISNDKVKQVAQLLFSCGLTESVEEGLLCIIPTLSQELQLPNEAAVESVVQQFEESESELSWTKSIQVYNSLSQLLSRGEALKRCRFTHKVIIGLVELQDRLRGAVKDLKGKLETEVGIGSVQKLRIHPSRDFGGNNFLLELEKARMEVDCTVQGLRDSPGIRPIFHLHAFLYMRQRRRAMVENAWCIDSKRLGTRYETNWSEIEAFKLAHPIHQFCQSTTTEARDQLEQSFLQFTDEEINEQDIAGWTPLHYLTRRIKGLVKAVNDCSVRALQRTNQATFLTGKPSVGDNPQSSLIDHLEANILTIHDAISVLLQRGANPNKSDSAGRTPLHLLARSGICESLSNTTRELGKLIILMLLEQGQAKLDIRSHDGATPLHYAGRYDAEMLQVIIERKKAQDSIYVTDKLKRTPLHWAVFHHGSASVNVLVNADFSTSAFRDLFHLTPLHLAVILQNLESARRLASTFGLEMEDGSRRTSLHQAVLRIGDSPDRTTSISICEALLDAHARISQVDNQGQTPLHYAFRFLPNDDACFGVITKLLKKALEGEKWVQSAVDYKGRTPFLAAILEQSEEFLQALFEKMSPKTRIESPDGMKVNGQTISVRKMVSAAERTWRDSDLAVKISDKTGSNAIHLFFLRDPGRERERPSMLTRLLEIVSYDDLLLNMPNNEGATPLVSAVSAFRTNTTDLDLIKLLLESKAQINKLVTVQNYPAINASLLRYNCSVLHKAIQKRDLKLLETLLQYGAYPGLQNEKGRTPIHYAAKYLLYDLLVEMLKGTTDQDRGEPRRNRSDGLESEWSEVGLPNEEFEWVESASADWVDLGEANVTDPGQDRSDYGQSIAQSGSHQPESQYSARPGTQHRQELDTDAAVDWTDTQGYAHATASIPGVNTQNNLEYESVGARSSWSAQPSATQARRIRFSKKVLDIRDKAGGMTAISLACSGWKRSRNSGVNDSDGSLLLRTIRKLVESGADPKIIDGEGKTNLMLVCSNIEFSKEPEELQLELVQLLIDAGLSANDIDYYGRTALMEAVQQKFALCVVQLLIKHTEKPFSLDSESKSALHYALEGGDNDIDQSYVKALSEPTFLLGEENFVDGYPVLIGLAMDPKLSDDHFRTLMRESQTAGGMGVFSEHKEGFITLQRLLLNWVEHREIGRRLPILRWHLSEGCYEELLKCIDQHGWTGYMCMHEQLKQARREEATKVTELERPLLKRPTSWSRVWKHRMIAIEDESGLTLSCYSEGIALADHPFWPSLMENYSQKARYFEVTIKTIGYSIAVGLVEGYIGSYSGALAYSNKGGLGWHSDNGQVYRFSDGSFKKLGELRMPLETTGGVSMGEKKVKYTQGDVVGVGVDEEQRLFFTKNGVRLTFVSSASAVEHPGPQAPPPNPVTEYVRGQIFPAVNLDREGLIKANFGLDLKNNPFRYPVTDEAEDELEQHSSAAAENSNGEPSTTTTGDGFQYELEWERKERQAGSRQKDEWEAFAGWG